MRFNKYIFLFSLLTLWLTSCREDLYYNQGNNPEYDDLAPDEYVINMAVENFDVRTRDVNFEPGASLRLNAVWMGIFDQTNGKCISNNFRSMNYVPITSGATQPGAIRMVLKKPTNPETGLDYNPADNNLVAVCIANFADVEYNYHIEDPDSFDNPSGVDDEEDVDDVDPKSLYYKLTHLKTWKEFIDISVQTSSAFSGAHNSDTPVLAGFMYDDGEKHSKSHIKVDQYAQDMEKVNLSPLGAVPQITLKYGKINTSDVESRYHIEKENQKVLLNEGMVLHLRRLVANINVKIEVEEGCDLELTDVKYMKYNVPRYVYLIERRTTNCVIDLDQNTGEFYIVTPGVFPTDPAHSPNYSDQHLDDEGGYYSDDKWNDVADPHSFSFQHFANKHWARKQPEKISDREKKVNGGTAGEYFDVLATSADDFNNYATYFVLKLHLVDQKSGRAFEAEYTIHEGLTSNELGVGIDKDTEDPDEINERLKDFSVSRNMNYTYTVIIAGASKIYHNATVGTPDDHNDGQGGRVWDMKYVEIKDDEGKVLPSYFEYATGSFINPVSKDGGLFENAITIENAHPDIAFRLYGYDSTPGIETIQGYNYLFPTESFEWLRGLWPEPSGTYSHYFKDYRSLVYEEIDDQGRHASIPDNILNGLRIIDPTNEVHRQYQGYYAQKEEQAKFIRENCWTIIDFVKELYVDEEDLENPLYANKDFRGRKFHIWVDKSNIEIEGGIPFSKRNNYVRAIYIGDRKGHLDYDLCTRLVNVYAAAQYPEYRELSDAEKEDLVLPKFEKITDTRLRVLDPYFSEFRVPYINGISLNDYEYHLTVGGMPCDIYGTPSEMGYISYRIPAYLFTADSNDIKLKAVSKNLFLKDSAEEVIGTLKLDNPYEWKKGDNGDWDKLLGNKSNQTSHLTIYDPTNQVTVQGNGFRFGTNGSKLKFTIYRPCKIQVKGSGTQLGDNGGKIYGADINGTSYQFTTTNKAVVTHTVSQKDIDDTGKGSLEISIGRAGATGTDIYSILVIP